MFGKFMNNYYYGKAGKGDYRKEDLPRTRWQLFWEMLRVRFSGLVQLNLITALAWLPALYVISLLVNGVYAFAEVATAVSADSAAATADQLMLVENRQAFFSALMLRTLLYLAPCIALTGPLQAGMAHVTRNWARDEHAFLWADFKEGVKENWKQGLGVAIITGLVPVMVFLGWQVYGQLGARNMLFVPLQMITLLVGILWMLAVTFMYPLMVGYHLSFGALLRNALLLALGRLPHTVGVRLVMLVPTLLAACLAYLLPGYALYALMGLAGYYLLIGNALARFVYASFSNAAFDRFINPRIEGAQVDRGLAPQEELEEEEEEPQG
ncbi:MAG: YesL family protein [Clostridiales bacterium]|nr:YesL family protein [Clostridiales bacterium]